MITPVIREDIEKIISEFEKELYGLEGKTVLATGGNGLIMGYVLDTIARFNERLTSPCKIIVMDKHPVDENSRLGHLLNDKNVSFITQDVGKKFDVVGKPNIIFHAASRANPTAFLADPIDTIDANVNGTRTLLEYARDNPLDNFIFFSSAEIYGNPTKEFIPTPETYAGNSTPLDRYACYTESKRLSETLCRSFYDKHHVPVKILRILLTYGPGIRNDGKAVSDFFDRAINERKITLRDAGEAKRSFCYVADTARAILRICFSGSNGEAYNIGHDLPEENITIRKLAETVAESVGPDVVVEPNFNAPKRQIYGEDNRWVNIDKLRALGFEPRFGIREGIERTKRYYDEKKH